MLYLNEMEQLSQIKNILVHGAINSILCFKNTVL